ncbi:MAG: ribonuclease HI [Balneolales bacterium]
MIKPSVTIYTDGACSGNPGPGGWGALLQWQGKEKTLSGGEPDTTNNRMELTAVVQALNSLKKPCSVAIHSDSALIINAFTQGWVENWLRRGWKKSDKKPVENRDLWEQLLKAMNPHDVTWIKVRGHADDKRNNRVDRLAVDACKKIQQG